MSDSKTINSTETPNTMNILSVNPKSADHSFHFENHFDPNKSGHKQSSFQSGLETAPLAAVIAGYCHFLGQFEVRSST